MHSIASELPVWTAIPFAALLACIAVLPLASPHFWDRNRNKGLVALALALPILAYLPLAFGADGVERLIESACAYISFIALLGSLFAITGGIHVGGSLSGTPLLNSALLGIGALLANAIGTTGASALLVRPLLRANEPRVRKAHIVVFFIFVVSNCGGLLTPLGDPPLFLGFLKGVPFAWTLRLWTPWLIVNGALLAIFNVWDQIVFAREERERPGSQLEEVMEHAPLRIRGKRNLLFLLAIVAVIAASGNGLGHAGRPWPFGIAELAMLAIAGTAWWLTLHEHRVANNFSFAPIVEVAVLFAGIFVTMTPALLLLNARAPGLGLREPWQFFWASGLLSSFLDNAPTYLTFAATACGVAGVPLDGRYLADFLALGPQSAAILSAIATGSVFMGANSYIGNGPNFMVKAIAEQNGVSMPSFFGYMAYSSAVLLPLFAVVTFVSFL
ncbi:MAG: sodium:proton antiporter [Deltaproteobacteria bacterium]|nr:MAG: sodium:proton antiporter [Deltaproteobacteria bacterium]